MTAQATTEAARQNKPDVTFDQIEADYFGVYVKLERVFMINLTIFQTKRSRLQILLAQHELNLEIFDSSSALHSHGLSERSIAKDTSVIGGIGKGSECLFPMPLKVDSLNDLSSVVVRHEQDALNKLISDSSLNRAPEKGITSTQTVQFCRRLSEIFRTRLFPDREIRMFVLLDEYESLLKVQQVAINTLDEDASPGPFDKDRCPPLAV
ncbi:MAG: hypothetical protein H7A44_12165 [Opitutaceae bacterium]|nr:hypothetical protein [Opitutaceae bacterium]